MLSVSGIVLDVSKIKLWRLITVILREIHVVARSLVPGANCCAGGCLKFTLSSGPKNQHPAIKWIGEAPTRGRSQVPQPHKITSSTVISRCRTESTMDPKEWDSAVRDLISLRNQDIYPSMMAIPLYLISHLKSSPSSTRRT